jgi:hypothetical protein
VVALGSVSNHTWIRATNKPEKFDAVPLNPVLAAVGLHRSDRAPLRTRFAVVLKLHEAPKVAMCAVVTIPHSMPQQKTGEIAI